MKATLKSIGIACCLFATALHLHAQGQIVPNGVTYAGFNGLGYEIDVVHDPVNNHATGFFLDPINATTFTFDGITDVGVRVFLVAANDPISLQPILSMNYTELTSPNNYSFSSGTPFYVGLFTGNVIFPPSDGNYPNPLFGWAELVNVNGTIELLNSALEYGGGGIIAGTQTIIPTPEPGTSALFALGATALFASQRKWRKNP